MGSVTRKHRSALWASARARIRHRAHFRHRFHHGRVRDCVWVACFAWFNNLRGNAIHTIINIATRKGGSHLTNKLIVRIPRAGGSLYYRTYSSRDGGHTIYKRVFMGLWYGLCAAIRAGCVAAHDAASMMNCERARATTTIVGRRRDARARERHVTTHIAYINIWSRHPNSSESK